MLTLFCAAFGGFGLGAAFTSIVFRDRLGGARRKQPGEAPARPTGDAWEVLEEGACECCGLVPFVDRRAVWLSYQLDREPATVKREWWCSFCVGLHFQRHSQGFYLERAPASLRGGSGADGVPSPRAQEGRS